MRDDARTRLLGEANKAFRPVEQKTGPTDSEKAQQSFQQNRERLKAERLTREANHEPHD